MHTCTIQCSPIQIPCSKHYRECCYVTFLLRPCQRDGKWTFCICVLFKSLDFAAPQWNNMYYNVLNAVVRCLQPYHVYKKMLGCWQLQEIHISSCCECSSLSKQCGGTSKALVLFSWVVLHHLYFQMATQTGSVQYVPKSLAEIVAPCFCFLITSCQEVWMACCCGRYHHVRIVHKPAIVFTLSQMLVKHSSSVSITADNATLCD